MSDLQSKDSTTALLLANQASSIVPQELLQCCHTLPQVIYLNLIKQDYNQLIHALKEYFAGQEISTFGLSKREANNLLLEVDYWISLYDVLSAGLAHIKQAKYEVKGKAWQMPLDITPAELLVHLLKAQVFVEFYKCQLPFYQESTRESKRHLQTIEDAMKGVDFPDMPERLAALQVAGRRVRRDFDWLLKTHYSLMVVCRRAAKKDRRLREKLNTHHQIEAKKRETLTRQMYTQPSLQWKNGIPKFGTKSGGSYT